jgi:hypothetical protein
MESEMNTSFRRLRSFALLALLVGLPHALQARDLPTCEFVVGNTDPEGGQGCHVEARPSETHVVGTTLFDIELAPDNDESSFNVIIDQRELRLPDASGWFRVLELHTLDSERDLRWLWAVEVANGPLHAAAQVRIVPLLQTGTAAEPIALEDPIYLSAAGSCTRIEGLWQNRESGGDTFRRLSLRTSVPDDCESLEGGTGRSHTLRYRDIGIPTLLTLGAIGRPAHHASLIDQGFVRLNLFDPLP